MLILLSGYYLGRGIPRQFLGPGMLFKQPEIKDLIAYLKFLADIERLRRFLPGFRHRNF